jgi:hypothetical protein
VVYVRHQFILCQLFRAILIKFIFWKTQYLDGNCTLLWKQNLPVRLPAEGGRGTLRELILSFIENTYYNRCKGVERSR